MTRKLALLTLTAFLLVPLAARAQEPQPAPLPPGPEGRLAPGDVARLFDAYAMVEAQEVLGLDDAQYARFVSRFKALQEARRQHQRARMRAVMELGRLARGEPAPTDDVLRDRLKALDDEDARAQVEIRKAQEGVDEVLTWQQRARFRAFEEQLERKKFDLMMRARQGARAPRPVRD